jgi:PUA-domain protein
MNIKNRHILNKKKKQKIEEEIKKNFTGFSFLDKNKVETGKIDDYKVVIVDEVVTFIKIDDFFVFTLHGLKKFKPASNFVVVDMGAVRFVSNGADVMSPGVVDADKDISADDIVWICDEKNHEPLAVGRALISGEEMISNEKGKALKILHYVGDKIWNLTSAKSL